MQGHRLEQSSLVDNEVASPMEEVWLSNWIFDENFKIFAITRKSIFTLNPFLLFTFTFVQLFCGLVFLFVGLAFPVLQKIFVGITRKSAKAQVNPEDYKNLYLDILVYPAARGY